MISTSGGIYARNQSGDALKVTSEGKITSGTGISARSATGNVSVTSTGDISATGSGIFSRTYGSAAASIKSTGTVSGFFGLYASSTSGSATIDNFGDVSGLVGLFARGLGAGAITITSTGNVSGTNNFAIYSDAGSGVVKVDSTGNVTANGSAILLKGGSSADLTLHSGTVSGGSNGVAFIAGGANTLKNYAAISGGALAVRGTTGNETINNYNLITGNVDLGTGANAFNNRAGAAFRSGPFVSVGAGNTLTNAGDLSPGGTGNVLTTFLTGKLVQTSTGTFTVDVDQAGAGADSVTVLSLIHI